MSSLGRPREGVKARRGRNERDGKARAAGQRARSRTEKALSKEVLEQKLIVRVLPAYGHKGKQAHATIALSVRDRAGPLNFTLVLKHSEDLLAQNVRPESVAQATRKKVLISSASPGKTIVQIKGSEFPLAGGKLLTIDFSVKNGAPTKSLIYISYAGITGEEAAKLATVGAEMNIQ